MPDGDNSEKDKTKFESYKDLYMIGTVGIQIVVSILIGFAFGLALDTWLDTKPWLMILFIIFGVASGFLNLFRVARQDRFK